MTASAKARLARLLDAVVTFDGQTVTSLELAGRLGCDATQIRRDISTVGPCGGKRGMGYDVDALAAALRRVLGPRRRLLVVGTRAHRSLVRHFDVVTVAYPSYIARAAAGTGGFDACFLACAEEGTAEALAHAGVEVVYNATGEPLAGLAGMQVVEFCPAAEIMGALR